MAEEPAAFLKPDLPKPGSAVSSPAQPSFQLSKETMRMKFMQRSEKKDGADRPKEVPPQEQIATTSRSGDASARKDFKWTNAVALPSPRDASDCAGCEPACAEVKAHVLSRRSFNGFNLAVERAYELMRDDPTSKGSKRLEKHAVSDVEMAKFYKDRVGHPKKESRGQTNPRSGSNKRKRR